MVFLYGFVFIKKAKLIAVVLFTDGAGEDGSGSWALTQPGTWTSLSFVEAVCSLGGENNGPLGATTCAGSGKEGDVASFSASLPKVAFPEHAWVREPV